MHSGQAFAKKLKERPSLKVNKAIVEQETKLRRSLDEFERDEIRYEILKKEYRGITDEKNLIYAIEFMDDTIAEYSKKAIWGENMSYYPIKIQFKDLSKINEKYATFDALGWKKGNRLYIFVNEKHKDAPPEALCALLAHEALHQDELNSLNEETYAWTFEAAVWEQLTEANADLENIDHPLIKRENTLKKLFERGDFSNKYIKKAVFTNPGYKNLPSRSPGFEDDDI